MRALFFLTWIFAAGLSLRAEEPFLESEFIFQPEHWHAHASCIVEAPNGDLLACWFQGSGERKSDDVKIEGARLRKGAKTWSKRFVMADTLGYPDTNCAMFVDPQERLWLLWPTILANTWESALLKARISENWQGDGAPQWSKDEVIHVTPGEKFAENIATWLDELESHPVLSSVDEDGRKGRAWLAHMRSYSTNKLNQRLGWMTRAHPFVLEGKRLIVPLYSDGFSFSLMAITDDWGLNWKTSAPLLGLGNIQPSIVQRKDGSLYTLMRDNGPAPKRLQQASSSDLGETWTKVSDSDLPNPGSGAEIIALKNGDWVLISNDTETGRNRLAVEVSDDEGKTWKWKRYLENQEQGQFHYPSIMQGRDGSLHATYSHHVGEAKTIKHAHFNEAWIKSAKPAAALPLSQNDVVAFVGGADVAAALHTGHLEALLAAKLPGARFRNFGWEGDTVFSQPRDFNFPPLKDHLKTAGASVIIVQYGRVESMIPGRDFRGAYKKMLDEFAQVTPRLVLVVPPPFEMAEPPLPDLSRHNSRHAEIANVIREVAEERSLPLIVLPRAQTSDGLQFTPQGNAALAHAMAQAILGVEQQTGPADRTGAWGNAAFEQLRQSVIAKNRLWFDYWRPQNWAFLGGDRISQPSSRDHRDPKIRWFPEEMKRFASLIAEAENKIQTAAHATR